MTEHKVKLPPGMPSKMKGLKRDEVGRPIPFFVGYPDGKPDFRTMDGTRLREAIMGDLCWVCGQRLLRSQGGLVGTFVAGPMCLINCTSAEPPAHGDCAEWCAKACPFLVNPNKVRRETGLEGKLEEAAGIAIARNPGVTALIESQKWVTWRPDGGGVLFNIQRIRSVEFFAQGERATVKDVMESIETGLPLLHDMAEEEGRDAVYDLRKKVRTAIRWVPDWDVALNTGDYPLTAATVDP